MKFSTDPSFARLMDRKDPLKAIRSQFMFPVINRKPSLYFTGNSLGLQTRATSKWVLEELEDWSRLGVEGHFHARRPWLYYHKFAKKTLSKITGAKPSEVVAMNQLTVNLHLMLTSFYRPSPERNIIIMEGGAFSSDQYAIESQLRLHGLDPKNALVEVFPRAGEHMLRTEDIVSAIKAHDNRVALVLFGAVQYYSGQFFDMAAITQAGHQAGAFVGFDLAHAIGNVPLALHKDQVDFAVWCSYKYLNAGPGGIAGAFVHERHGNNPDLLRMAGWWGHEEKNRFKMRKGFVPMPGADGWQLSNFPVLSGAALLASLQIFEKTGMKALRSKSLLLTGYLEFLLHQIPAHQDCFTIITPQDPKQRGCQLSLLMHRKGKVVFDRLTRAGVIADWREPNVIRVAPAPLYNNFQDVFELARIFKNALK
jgi:kynureninase